MNTQELLNEIMHLVNVYSIDKDYEDSIEFDIYTYKGLRKLFVSNRSCHLFLSCTLNTDKTEKELTKLYESLSEWIETRAV